jgi:predicted AAA+ superfamily ATPase
MSSDQNDILKEVRRIADALDRISASTVPPAMEDEHQAFVWNTGPDRFQAVPRVSHVPLHLLKGIDHQTDALYSNTSRFAQGLPANNALLWGARGTGKSSLVKAVHADIASSSALTLIEIHREDLESLPRLLSHLSTEKDRRFIVFCDDLAFEGAETSYKSLKAVLEGGIEGKPEGVIFYATSNRRHLMSRDMIDNERSTAINPSEAVEEKVSLSDRFGLWLGFHSIDQDTFLVMINAYADAIGLATSPDERTELHRAALEWSVTRGSRSGRVAWQFITDMAGASGVKVHLS